MIRKIIKIDEDKCIGCGLCAEACHEGAIGLVNGKAKLLRADYCDGLGDCLPACPVDAISFEEREALAYDEKAVEESKKAAAKPLPCGCPGTNQKRIERKNDGACEIASAPVSSRLSQWPVQIKLVAPNAPYFGGAHLLVAADCTAYAYGNFHNDFIKNKVCIIGCPKLDMVDYTEKLTAIISENDIKSVTVVRMDVPCCGGLAMSVRKAIELSGKDIPIDVDVVTTNGEVNC